MLTPSQRQRLRFYLDQLYGAMDELRANGQQGTDLWRNTRTEINETCDRLNRLALGMEG